MEEEQKSNYTCKFCPKIFSCGRSLGGHMRSHSITINRSDHEPTLCKRKRSDRLKRNTNNTKPSCLNPSPSDQQEQEEVALSLILLSMESSNLERESTPPRKRLIKSNENLEIEVNSPEASIKESRSINPFGSDDYHKKRKRIIKKKCINSRNYFPLEYKFSCMICRKGFHSYQALGGHRASHKKLKGCCDPTNDEFQEKIDGCKKSEDYERPTCLESFPSSHEGIRGFLDLNLPAPVEEEWNEFKPWWIGTSHNYLLSS